MSIHHQILVVLATFIGTTSANAEVVPLVNGDFEEPVLKQSTMEGLVGWQGDQVETAIGADLQPPVPAAGGNQIAYSPSPEGDNFLFYQQSSEPIQEDTVYNLSLDVYPLIDDPNLSCLAVEMVPTSFTGIFANRFWRSENFSNDPPFAPFETPDTIHPIANQWNRINVGFNSSDFFDQVSNGDRIQIQVRGHQFAIDNIQLTKGIRDYFISFTEGDDQGTGLTPEDPWKTFININDVMLAPGSSVRLKRGDIWEGSQLRLYGKGTESAPVHLGAYGYGPKPIITGMDLLESPAIVINNSSHFQVADMDCRDAKIGLYLRYTGTETDGTGSMFGNSNVSIAGCHFQNMDEEWSDGDGDISVQSPYEISWGAGIWIGGSVPSPPGGAVSDQTTILDGLSIRDCSLLDVSTGIGSNWYFPPVFKGRVKNIYIEDVFISGCENGGISLSNISGGAARRVDTVRGGTGFYSDGTTAAFFQHAENFVVDNCEFAYAIRSNTSNDGVGFDYEGDCHDMTFTNNVIHNNDGGGLLILDSPNPPGLNNSNLIMDNNTFWNNCRNPREGSGSQNKVLRYPNTGSTGSFQNNGIYIGQDVGEGSLLAFDNIRKWQDFSPIDNRFSERWADVKDRPLSWSFESTAEGWIEGSGLSIMTLQDEMIQFTITESSAELLSPATWVNTREYGWVNLQLSSTMSGMGRLQFQTETDQAWSPSKSLLFDIPETEDPVTLKLLLRENQAFKGVVTSWRLQFMNMKNSSISIDEFSARRDPLIVEAISNSDQTIRLMYSQLMNTVEELHEPENYYLTGIDRTKQASLTPSSITQLITKKGLVYEVRFDDAFSPNTHAILSVQNVKDLRGNAIQEPNVKVVLNSEDLRLSDRFVFY